MDDEFEIVKRLKKEYASGPKTFLRHKNVYQLLAATILSAQCTDLKVNQVTAHLFKRYPQPKDYSKLNPSTLERQIRSIGLYKSKAKNIISSAKIIVSRHGGKVPKTMEELTRLPGVGRKTANIVLYAGYGLSEGVAVDTHVFRLSKRMGLTSAKTPQKAELDLMRLYPKSSWGDINHLFVTHGRSVCQARKPRCSECALTDICPKKGVATKY